MNVPLFRGLNMTHIITKLFARYPRVFRRNYRIPSLKTMAARILMCLADFIFRLNPGILNVTSGAEAVVDRQKISDNLSRHLRTDWGDVSKSQWHFNDVIAGTGGGTLHSRYWAGGETFLHILTYHCTCKRRWLWTRRTLVCLPNEIRVRSCECVWSGLPAHLVPNKKQFFPAEVWESLSTLLAYLWSEEADSFRAATPSQRMYHVLRDTAIVSDWLYGPEEVARGLDAIVEGFAAYEQRK
jgi:hypothetical protein